MEYAYLNASWCQVSGARTFWGIVGVVIGFFAADGKEALRAGVWYGTVLVLSFLFSGFKGSADKLLGFSLLAVVGAIIGAGCGLVLALIGHRLKRASK